MALQLAAAFIVLVSVGCGATRPDASKVSHNEGGFGELCDSTARCGVAHECVLGVCVNIYNAKSKP